MDLVINWAGDPTRQREVVATVDDTSVHNTQRFKHKAKLGPWRFWILTCLGSQANGLCQNSYSGTISKVRPATAPV